MSNKCNMIDFSSHCACEVNGIRSNDCVNPTREQIFKNRLNIMLNSKEFSKERLDYKVRTGQNFSDRVKYLIETKAWQNKL